MNVMERIMALTRAILGPTVYDRDPNTRDAFVTVWVQRHDMERPSIPDLGKVGRRCRGAKSGHPVVPPKTFDP